MGLKARSRAPPAPEAPADQPAPPAATTSPRVPALIVAGTALAAAASAWAFRGARAFGDLRAGACAFGTPQAPGTVHALHVSELQGLRLPAGFKCPVVIRGLEGTEAWRDFGAWGDLKELEKRTPATVSFDASGDGVFAYWDNASLLSGRVREVGVLSQGYMKVREHRKTFYKALREGNASRLGSVRYGGKVQDFSRDLARRLGEQVARLQPEGPEASEPLLWLSSEGSYSTAHYDSFHNVFVMVGGEKEVLLAPPTDAHLFQIYPGVHPLARQARLHFGMEAGVPAAARVLSATVGRGEAVFIPAGWLHHIVAKSLATSLAMTALPREHHEFNAWMMEGSEAVLPFVENEAAWSTKRLAAALRTFVPAVLRAVDFVQGGQDFLKVFAEVSYGAATRKELGFPGKLPRFKACAEPDAKDAAAAEAAAQRVAQRLNGFQEDLRGLYIIPYLETALSRVAGSERDPTKIMQRTASFVDTCLRL